MFLSAKLVSISSASCVTSELWGLWEQYEQYWCWCCYPRRFSRRNDGSIARFRVFGGCQTPKCTDRCEISGCCVQCNGFRYSFSQKGLWRWPTQGFCRLCKLGDVHTSDQLASQTACLNSTLINWHTYLSRQEVFYFGHEPLAMNPWPWTLGWIWMEPFYGDSGGARFIKQGESWVLVGLTSRGNMPCITPLTRLLVLTQRMCLIS